MRTEEQKRRNAEAQKRWRAANPEKVRAFFDNIMERDPDYFRRSARAWRENNPEKNAISKRKSHIRTYGITPEQYDAMVISQSGKCAICGESPSRALDVDHCHATGVVRGLLCSYCNKAIGMFRDSAEYLRSAIKYLEGRK